jgi:methionine synthase I (cobalamin-dependent)
VAGNVVEALRRGTVLADGGHVEEARTRGYGTPRVVVEFPMVVRLIHRDYFRAGAQILRAQTARLSRGHLAAGGWEHRLAELNRAAVRLARQEAGGGPGDALVAGCLDPAPAGGGGRNVTGAGAVAGVARAPATADWDAQIEALVEEGVDLLFGESFTTLGEARRALSSAKRTGLPVVMTLDLSPGADETADGVGPAEWARALTGGGADVVGVSGSREPRDMWPLALRMREVSDVPVAFLPGGYRTSVPNWQAMRESMVVAGHEMARYALQAKMHGIHLIGGSDGAGPELLRFMAQALDCERVAVDLHRR